MEIYFLRLKFSFLLLFYCAVYAFRIYSYKRKKKFKLMIFSSLIMVRCWTLLEVGKLFGKSTTSKLAEICHQGLSKVAGSLSRPPREPTIFSCCWFSDKHRKKSSPIWRVVLVFLVKYRYIFLTIFFSPIG